MSKAVHLQKHLYDLTERERLSKLHNWELLQQFEDAQKTLKKMLDRTAAMKNLRKEYESYLWSCSHQDNQLHVKAQTTLQNMPGGHQVTCQKNSDTSCTLLSHALGKMPRTTGAYHGETFPPDLQPSWQTMAQKQIAVFPNQASEKRWDITQSSPLSFPHSYLVGSHHLPSTHSLQPSASLQTSPSTDHPGLSLSKQCLSDCNASDQHYNTHHSTPQSQKERVPKRPLPSPSIQSEQNIIHNEDIDIKPVRLSSHSHSCRTSSQGSTQNKDKNNQSSSSDESHYSSHNSSPLRAVATGLKAALKSESDNSETSSHRTSKQSNGLGFKDTRNTSGDSLSDNKDNESDKEVCNSDKMSGSAQMPQKGVSRLKDIATPEETKASISDQSSLQDEDEDSEKENSYEDGTEACQENANIPRYSSEEEADGSDDDANQESTESASSESEGGEDNMEEPVSNEDNGQKVDKTKTPEDSDSEDCIVSPQTRSKVIYIIPEHPSEHDASSRKTASSDDDQESSGSSDDIEQVLAPQENTQEDIKQPKFDEANETCDIVARFCVKEERNEDHSNESDDFYG